MNPGIVPENPPVGRETQVPLMPRPPVRKRRNGEEENVSPRRRVSRLVIIGPAHGYKPAEPRNNCTAVICFKSICVYST
ncbi:Hypothetical protein SMAX5B_009553 [Scophthalmus maximus]|uniref:Uncharacterized protein n=1 Tax=Scophthalmus maximus TaxID=52904 RepID=A0A2U9AZE5_SCOMX|nr:Hypothetical protein SMAX5B_009553 [Scophthalmus maximus]